MKASLSLRAMAAPVAAAIKAARSARSCREAWNSSFVASRKERSPASSVATGDKSTVSMDSPSLAAFAPVKEIHARNCSKLTCRSRSGEDAKPRPANEKSSRRDRQTGTKVLAKVDVELRLGGFDDDDVRHTAGDGEIAGESG